MSKITNDGLTRSADTGSFKTVPIWQHYGCQRVKAAYLTYMSCLSIANVQ